MIDGGESRFGQRVFFREKTMNKLNFAEKLGGFLGLGGSGGAVEAEKVERGGGIGEFTVCQNFQVKIPIADLAEFFSLGKILVERDFIVEAKNAGGNVGDFAIEGEKMFDF